MSRGFQTNYIAEYAACTELAAQLRQADDAENAARWTARRAIDQGARAEIIAAQVGISRASLYRWMAGHARRSAPAHQPERDDAIARSVVNLAAGEVARRNSRAKS